MNKVVSSDILAKSAPPRALWVGMVVMVAIGGGAGVDGPGAAYLLGYSITMALIAWLVLWFGFLKRHPGQKPWVVYLWLYAATFSGGYAVNLFQEAQVNAARASLVETVKQYQGGGRIIDTRAHAKGQIGTVEAFAKNFIAVSTDDIRDYEAEISGVDLESIFSEPSLVRPEGIQRARFKLERAKEITSKYKALADDRQADFEAQIAKLDISEDLKQHLYDGFAEGKKNNEANRKRAWDIEEEIIDEFDKAISVLARSPGLWLFEGGELRFHNQEDLEDFNNHIEKAQLLADEQQLIREHADEYMTSSFQGR